MAGEAGKPAPEVKFYDATYGGFATDLYARIRRHAFGEDIGQNSWLTADEQDRFIEWLQLGPGKALLDIACGSGATTLRIAQRTGCSVVGIDIHREAIERGRELSSQRHLEDTARFELVDAGRALPFADGVFDALICIDAINHLPDRAHVLSEWARVLKPAGRLLFTDPIIVCGPLTSEEIRIRSSIGFFLFVPSGYDEQVIAGAGLRLLQREDVTGNMAEVAGRWADARSTSAEELRKVEGEAGFDGQQAFLCMTRDLAASRRLTRCAFLAEK